MVTKTEAEARVAKGAAHLDVVRPGWFNRVDTGTLTLESPCLCVMGQTYGEYWEGCEKAGIEWSNGGDDEIETQAQAFGFYKTDEASWEQLQDAWIAAIAARRHPVAEEQDTERSASAPATHAVREELGRPVVAIRASTSSSSSFGESR